MPTFKTVRCRAQACRVYAAMEWGMEQREGRKFLASSLVVMVQATWQYLGGGTSCSVASLTESVFVYMNMRSKENKRDQK